MAKKDTVRNIYPEWSACGGCPYAPAFCGKDILSCRGEQEEKDGASGKTEGRVPADQ